MEDIVLINPMYNPCETFYDFMFNFFIIAFIVHADDIFISSAR